VSKGSKVILVQKVP
jgi:hypothetical protein